MKPILSILTPGIPTRMTQITELCNNLAEQIGNSPVEHLVLIDNRKRTIGEKRDALLRAAKGSYVAFCDDDDFPYSNYVSTILKASESNPDVITFNQYVDYNGQTGEVYFKLGHPNEGFKPGGITLRNAWHVCAWRRSIAVMSSFPASNYGEDWAFASKLCQIEGLKEVHIDEVIHKYIHNAATTAAPPPLTNGNL